MIDLSSIEVMLITAIIIFGIGGTILSISLNVVEQDLKHTTEFFEELDKEIKRIKEKEEYKVGFTRVQPEELESTL